MFFILQKKIEEDEKTQQNGSLYAASTQILSNTIPYTTQVQIAIIYRCDSNKIHEKQMQESCDCQSQLQMIQWLSKQTCFATEAL